MITNVDGNQSLSELAVMVRAEVERFALTIADLMLQASERAPSRFERWIAHDTPFTVAEGARLRAVAICHRDLPPEAVSHLPQPSAALTYLFEAADTTPHLSPTSRITREDLLGGALLGGDPEALSEAVRTRLQSWLSSGHERPATCSPRPTPPPDLDR